MYIARIAYYFDFRWETARAPANFLVSLSNDLISFITKLSVRRSLCSKFVFFWLFHAVGVETRSRGKRAAGECKGGSGRYVTYWNNDMDNSLANSAEGNGFYSKINKKKIKKSNNFN